MKMDSICVFCGSHDGNNEKFKAAAVELGQLIAKNNMRLVYGGAHVGLMGAVADSALRASGKVIGVMPEHLAAKEIAHRGITELKIVQTMHERKAIMSELSDGFIALPGGYGTLEEFCEMLTWSMLGIRKAPCGLLNIDGFFDHLLKFFDWSAECNFISKEHRDLILVSDTPADLLKQVREFKHSGVERYYENKKAN
jgi:uncharacterized protein (TIGR00730 family)